LEMIELVLNKKISQLEQTKKTKTNFELLIFKFRVNQSERQVVKRP
jgi:hypothetical protein